MSTIASHSPLNISQKAKPLETEAWFQRTTNRKWPTENQMVTWSMTLRGVFPIRRNPIHRNPFRRILKKYIVWVNAVFCGKNRTPYLQLLFFRTFCYIVILSLRNIPSMQHYVLLILRHSRVKRESGFGESGLNPCVTLKGLTRDTLRLEPIISRKHAI